MEVAIFTRWGRVFACRDSGFVQQINSADAKKPAPLIKALEPNKLMNQSTATTSFDYRSLSYGLMVFIAMVFVLPFTLVFIASFGPNEWIYSYIGPALKYKFILIFISGLSAGFLNKHSPLVSSILVGIIGSIIIALILSISAISQNHEVILNTIIWQCFYTIILCSAGGFCVSIFRYMQAQL